jgi:hypothetical protein
MLQAGRSRVILSMRLLHFLIDPILQPHYGPGVDSASNRNEYQKSSWELKERPERKADNLTAICEAIV